MQYCAFFSNAGVNLFVLSSVTLERPLKVFALSPRFAVFIFYCAEYTDLGFKKDVIPPF